MNERSHRAEGAAVAAEAAAAQENGSAPAAFRGIAQVVLDAKGRLAIPARHRDGLANGASSLVITADPGGCLLLYPLAAWEPIQARLMSLSSFDEQIRTLQRLLVGHADDVEIDSAGRILIPPALRRYARLEKHVVLVGQGRKFELWDEAAWQAQTAKAVAFPASGLPPELDGFSL